MPASSVVCIRERIRSRAVPESMSLYLAIPNLGVQAVDCIGRSVHR